MLLGWHKVGMTGQKPDMPAKGYTWRTMPDLNHWIWKKYHSMDLTIARKNLNNSFNELKKVIASHTNDELFEKKKYKRTRSTSIGAYLVSAASNQYALALKLIKKHSKSKIRLSFNTIVSYFSKSFPYYYSMRNMLTLLCLIFMPFLGITQVKSDDIIGVWLTEVKDAKIEIYKKNSKFYGKVVWIKEAKDKNGQPVKDSNNPDEAKKSQLILGMDIITGLIFKNSEWAEGNIYDPKNGETYTCKLWLEEGKLKVRGYAGWFYDTKTWTKTS